MKTGLMEGEGSVRINAFTITAKRWQKVKSIHWRRRTEEDAEESFNVFHYMAHLNHRGIAP